MKKASALLLAMIAILLLVGCTQPGSSSGAVSDMSGSDTAISPPPVAEVPDDSAAPSDNDEGAQAAQSEQQEADVEEPEQERAEPDESPDAAGSFEPIQVNIRFNGNQQNVMFYPFVERTQEPGLSDFVIYIAENHEVVFWDDAEGVYQLWADTGAFPMSFSQTAGISVQRFVAMLTEINAGAGNVSVTEPTADFPFYVIDTVDSVHEGYRVTIYAIDNGQGGFFQFNVTLSMIDEAHGHGARVRQSLSTFEILPG